MTVNLGGGGRVVGKEPAQFNGIVQLLFGCGKAGDELFQGVDLGQRYLRPALVVPEVRGGGLLF